MHTLEELINAANAAFADAHANGELSHLGLPERPAPPAVAVEAKWSDTSAPGIAAALFTPWP